jgi:hypothetical protein
MASKKIAALQAELIELKKIVAEIKVGVEKEEAKSAPDIRAIILLDAGIHQREILINRIENRIAKMKAKNS